MTLRVCTSHFDNRSNFEYTDSCTLVHNALGMMMNDSIVESLTLGCYRRGWIALSLIEKTLDLCPRFDTDQDRKVPISKMAKTYL